MNQDHKSNIISEKYRLAYLQLLTIQPYSGDQACQGNEPSIVLLNFLNEFQTCSNDYFNDFTASKFSNNCMSNSGV